MSAPARCHCHEAIRHPQAGFSLIELIIVLAIITVLAGIATPSLQGWMRTYQLKSAAMDLYSNMQLAKINAVKENRTWGVHFDATDSTYTIVRCLTDPCTGTLGTDYQVISSVNLKTEYNNAVQYKHPPAQNPLRFRPTGLIDIGFVSLSNDISSTYYQVGSDSMAGTCRIQKKNGSS